MQTETDRSRWQATTALVTTSSAGSQILENFRDSKEYRHAFVEEKVRTWIAAQIKAIREQRKIKRPEFANMMGKAPSWVFRLEDPNQPPPTISTLLQVAEAFDVDLNIQFASFSDLVHRLDRTTPESFEVPSFDEECEGGAFEKVSPAQSVVELTKALREKHINTMATQNWIPAPPTITTETLEGIVKMPPVSERELNQAGRTVAKTHGN